MRLEDVMTNARDAVSVKRVFNDPYERDGVTVIGAAKVSGGGGGGVGHDDKGGEGEGGGFGAQGRPTGAYVVSQGQVSWRPAVDVNRLLTVLGAVAITYLLTHERLERARLRAQ